MIDKLFFQRGAGSMGTARSAAAMLKYSGCSTAAAREQELALFTKATLEKKRVFSLT
jgi:hypothetical protein